MCSSSSASTESTKPTVLKGAASASTRSGVGLEISPQMLGFLTQARLAKYRDMERTASRSTSTSGKSKNGGSAGSCSARRRRTGCASRSSSRKPAFRSASISDLLSRGMMRSGKEPTLKLCRSCRDSIPAIIPAICAIMEIACAEGRSWEWEACASVIAALERLRTYWEPSTRKTPRCGCMDSGLKRPPSNLRWYANFSTRQIQWPGLSPRESRAGTRTTGARRKRSRKKSTTKR